MPWLRIDDSFANHPRITALTDSELRVWLRVLCYCARYRRPVVDEITRRAVPGLSTKRMARFIDLGLLDATEGGAWEVRDWTTFQPNDPTAAERKARWRARLEEGRR